MGMNLTNSSVQMQKFLLPKSRLSFIPIRTEASFVRLDAVQGKHRLCVYLDTVESSTLCFYPIIESLVEGVQVCCALLWVIDFRSRIVVFVLPK